MSKLKRNQLVGATCKGSYVLGSACGDCARCREEQAGAKDASNEVLFAVFKDFLNRVNEESFAYLSPTKQRDETIILDELKKEIERRGLSETVTSFIGLLNSTVVGPPEQQVAGIDKTVPLAKVMTNDETPRCPFCASVKIQQISAMMPGFNRWTCHDCHGSFRAPVKGKAA